VYSRCLPSAFIFENKNAREKHGRAIRGSRRVVPAGFKRKRKNSSRRSSSDEAQLTEMKTVADTREKMFVRRDDDETAVALRARALPILAMVCSSSVNARNEFMNRDFNHAINIRRFMAFETRPEALTRSNFIEESLRLEASREKLRPIKAADQKRLGSICAWVYVCPLDNRGTFFVSLITIVNVIQVYPRSLGGYSYRREYR
jgi:hypothetical protein